MNFNSVPNLPLFSFIFFFYCFSGLSIASNSIKNEQNKKQYHYTNSLIKENSPYLLQHAHNPVDWFAWTKEAFLKAKKENRPIFLSIGYSTCHWCHVMEKESFENIEIANILNQNFISIKVDREQRPDVDALYMRAAMLVNGSGGWPLNVFITPQGDFFYGASYFPPKRFKQILLKVSSLWKNDPQRLLKMAASIKELTRQQQLPISLSGISQFFSPKNISQYRKNTRQAYLKRFDVLQGGFSQAPKFPNEAVLFFLIDSLYRNYSPEVDNAVDTTLSAMSNGGIYDHVGGGFHRYSVDNNWFAPHFEKMLYNQANLSLLYMQFYLLTNNLEYKEIAKQTIDYVIRDMKHDLDFSAFYSASDADSKATLDGEAEEGLFFLWKKSELIKILSEKEFLLVSDVYSFSQQGNFVEAGIGYNILFRNETLTDYARIHNLSLTLLIQDLNNIKAKLYQLRHKRISPAIDRKIVTSWNAMMISSLAKASQVYKNKQYLQYAISAANYINKYNIDSKTGYLLRSSIDAKANVLASQDDYAYYARALINLYDQTKSRVWLNQAQKLVDQMEAFFWDKESGGFFQNNPFNEVEISSRLKDIYDGAIPSGNSIAMEVLSLLIKRSSDQRLKIKYQELSDKMLAYYASVLNLSTQKPSNILFSSMPYMLMAIENYKLGDSALLKYGANGNLRAELIPPLSNSDQEKDLAYTLKIVLKTGWHINSHSPLQKNLIKTSIEIGDIGANETISGKNKQTIADVSYPNAIIKKLGFSKTKLSLYENNLEISFKIKSKTTKVNEKKADRKNIPIKLSFQACSDQVCLAPEKIRFSIIQ
jgi:uncharacterized protein YyaL (SSP411 family)